jgi:uncharacterized RDD family membrane protein YckC
MTAFGAVTARWWKRVIAILIDWVILAVVDGVIRAIVGSSAHRASSGGSGLDLGRVAELYLLGLAVAIAYFGYLNGVRTQTVGKMALRIRVIRKDDGRPIGFGKGVVRELTVVGLSMLCWVPAVVDALTPLWDDRRQAWHDHAVNSLVVNA